MALRQGQYADLLRVVQAGLAGELTVPVVGTYEHNYLLPYVVILPDSPGDLDRQMEVHGRSRTLRVELYAETRRRVNELAEQVFAIFRHQQNFTWSAVDGPDIHEITFVQVSFTGGSNEVYRGEAEGYWTRQLFTFEYAEV